MIKVYDNFLPEYYFKHLQSELLGLYMPWYYNDFIVNENQRGKYQFAHKFYLNKECSQKYLDLQETFNIIIQRLNIKNLYRIKANLNPRSFFNRSGGYHVDNFNCQYTSIYYINTNNGCTKFKNNGRVKRVQSIENRMVVFPANIQHQGITCTNKSRRVVINFNFDQHEVSSHL